MVLKAKEKVVRQLIAARFEDISVLIFALTGILSRRVGVLVHKGEVHQHPERICTKILHKMKLVFLKNQKNDSHNVLASCNNSKRRPALRYYCQNVLQLV